MSDKDKEIDLDEKADLRNPELNKPELVPIDSIQIQEFKDVIKYLRSEISYTHRELNQKKIQIGSVLDESSDRLEGKINRLENSAKKSEDFHQKLHSEVEKVIMTPDMMQKRITAIVPELAEAIEQIYDKKNTQFIEQYNEQARKLDHLFTENMLRIQSVTKEVLKDTESISNKTRSGFFKTILFAGIFSGIIAAITSYYVTHHFPTNVRVTGATSIEVSKSKVSVWGGNVNNVGSIAEKSS